MSRSVLRRLALSMGAVAALGACSGDINPVRDVAISAGVGQKRPDGQDFVRDSRPATLDYRPVGRLAAERDRKARTPTEVKALEAQVDKSRAAVQAAGEQAKQAGQTPAPVSPKVSP
ncbi:MAG TPA: hypothetical protein VIL65_09620 [Beijerinckiaceae bacterium]